MVKVITKNKIRSALSGVFFLVCSSVPMTTGAVELVAHEATYNMSYCRLVRILR